MEEAGERTDATAAAATTATTIASIASVATADAATEQGWAAATALAYRAARMQPSAPGQILRRHLVTGIPRSFRSSGMPEALDGGGNASSEEELEVVDLEAEGMPEVVDVEEVKLAQAEAQEEQEAQVREAEQKTQQRTQQSTQQDAAAKRQEAQAAQAVDITGPGEKQMRACELVLIPLGNDGREEVGPPSSHELEPHSSRHINSNPTELITLILHPALSLHPYCYDIPLSLRSPSLSLNQVRLSAGSEQLVLGRGRFNVRDPRISAEHVRLERSRTGTGARLTVHATGRNPVELSGGGRGRPTLLLQRAGQASAPLVDGDELRLVVDRNEFANKRRWERWAGNACAYRARLKCK